MKLDGAVVAITGSSRGIGQALAESLREHGATVYGCASSKHGDIAAVDVRNAADVEAFIGGIIKEHGHIDLLINNAAVAHDAVPLEDISIEEYDHCMRVNIDGVANGMRVVLPHMKKKNSGAIVNIASTAGSSAHPTLSAYCASKFAVIGLTQTVAKELKDIDSAVQCFTVSPGGVNTDMRADLFGDDDASRQQSPETVAKHIINILTDDTGPENGVDIKIVRGEIVAKVPMQ